MDNSQDYDLGEKFAHGGEPELEEVVRRYGKKLFNYCFHTVCDYHAAEDITQTVFIKAYKSRSSFRGNSSLSTWLFRIAHNTCIDYIRKERPTLSLFEIQDIPVNAPREPEEFTQEVLTALTALTPKERAVVYGKVFEEMSFNELAEISGISLHALRKRYERAKRKLASSLQSEYTAEGGRQHD